LDWWCCYPTRLLRLSCRFTFDFLLDWLATHFFFWKNTRKCHAHFPFFFRSGASKWVGNLVGRPQQVCFSFESQHFNLFFVAVANLYFSF
jgi:hypothetical protein